MTKQEIIEALRLKDASTLFRRADEIRKTFCGDEIHLRGLIEFSNCCNRNCIYCGIRKGNADCFRYRMSADEIFSSAEEAARLGYGTVVLQSGEDEDFDFNEFCIAVRKIKSDLGVAVTACIGEKSYEEYEWLRKAGADRYLMRFETSNEELFRRFKPGSLLKNRLQCLEWLRALGYQVGSGVMVGLPGQTAEILADDILLMKSLDLDMIGIGPFIPHPGTPLADAEKGNIDLTLKVIAITRIITSNTHIPATTAIGSLDPQGRQKALKCGANVIMPNVTPKKYRKHYEIYPGKICISENPSDCGGCVRGMAHSLGRKVGTGFGDSLKKSASL